MGVVNYRIPQCDASGSEVLVVENSVFDASELSGEKT